MATVSKSLSTEVHTQGRGVPRVFRTLEEALTFIDNGLAPDLAALPRWTFARALLLEAARTGKSRDMTTAIRQFKQALRNERWLVDD